MEDGGCWRRKAGVVVVVVVVDDDENDDDHLRAGGGDGRAGCRTTLFWGSKGEGGLGGI